MAINLSDLPEHVRAQVEAKHPVARRSRTASERPDLEGALLAQLRMVGLPAPVTQHRFHPERRWRFDMAWPDKMVAVEVDGGTWTNGGHVRGAHFDSDAEKGNEALLLGWRVLHVTTNMVSDGRAVAFVERALHG